MVDADPHNPGGEGSAPGGRLRLINLVVLQVVELNRQRSILLSALHYSSDLTKTNYSAFYTVFLEVYKLTQTLISDDLNKELNNWVIASTSGDTKISKSDLRRKGLELADKLVDELSELASYSCLRNRLHRRSYLTSISWMQRLRFCLQIPQPDYR